MWPALHKSYELKYTASQNFVSKQKYKDWEKKVVAAFYTPTQLRTNLTPTDGHIALLSKEKFILVVDKKIGKQSASTQVAQANFATLAANKKTKIRMWHIENQALEYVNFGLEDDLFFHAACDLGGLTNLRQKIAKNNFQSRKCRKS